MMNEAKKNLLSKDPNGLRALHDVLHIDFCKPAAFLQIEGRFTINQAEKLAAAAGYSVDNAIIAILTTGGKRCFDYKLNLVTIEDHGKINLDYKTPYEYRGKRCEVDNYYSKSDFESTRKLEDITSFIICQKCEDLSEVNAHPVDISNRFIITKINKWCKQCGGTSYIGDIETRRTDDDGSKYTHNKTGRVIYANSRKESENINDFIDKK